MTLAATFLGGAKSRLLPASIPFRFFAAAAIFHVLMWLALLAGAEQVTSFRGGPGSALAAVHLLTLGVFAATAIGASVQLLPVATRHAFAAIWPIKLVFWLTVPGMIALVVGMYAAHTLLMIAAAVVTTLGLVLFGGILADNLRRAGSLGAVAAYGWVAFASLVLLVVLGALLTFDYELGMLPDHAAMALAHLILGGFGFMGMLALGFSHVLVPMFALAAAPAKRPSFVGFGLAVAALALGTLGALADSTAILTSAALFGLAAAGVHLWLMQRVLADGMRKRLGLSFVLIRFSWAMLLITLVAGIAALHGWLGPNGAALFGLALFGGWLLTFLLGVLQRILPFLASMHANRAAGAAPPLLSEMAGSTSLKMHAACHGTALVLMAAAIAMDGAWLVQIGSAVGLVGALAFAWFTAEVTRRVAFAGRQ
jgi:hypothetical protein